ncbi:anti-sigma factor RsiW [Rhizobium sp. SG_E_25_P2]|uniref:anti-sigma factor family protein n=1 Tax=Rhizobium sp. SG_E_25_P2 TaxID=2879942 RepID=UPI0024743D4C|nr:anti-sigma factor [Rhizobium sp. SG_E_25_P2]MDH6267834.1 anti-sigma factor RsiW [Rhizobium sp. SG_E_25_P2]
MSEDAATVSTEMLHAYVDGELSPDEAARIEEWLARHPDAAAEIAEWRRQNAEIKSMFARYEKARPGDQWRMRATPRRLPRGRVLRWAGATGMAILVFLAGNLSSSLISFSAKNNGDDPPLQRQASANFLVYASDMRHPVEVWSDEKDHLVAWLGKRLGASLSAPDLSSLGFSLVGGRLVPVDEKAGALLMYEDSSGKRLTVLIGRNGESRETSFRFAAQGPIETFYWIDRDLSYAVTGEISRETLRRIADECYRQFQI